MEVSNLFVCLMGMGVTFFGLTCLIGLITLLGKFAESSAPTPSPAQTVIPPAADAIPNRQELIAAVSAALAEELGTDVTAIRILSFKKVS
ncbi:MAG: OadG family protein [Oscillospiraceae bacterium]|nr:OadG family protein [Oscillospiraceae bacterium]